MAVAHLYLWQDMRSKFKKKIQSGRKISKNKPLIPRFNILVKYFLVVATEHVYFSYNKLSDHILRVSWVNGVPEMLVFATSLW